MIDSVVDLFDEQNIEKINYRTWAVVNKRWERLQVESKVDQFLDYFKQQVQTFIVHDFQVKKTKSICKPKNELNPLPMKPYDQPASVLLQCDFAENYTCTL